MGEIKKMNVAFFDGEFTCHTNENRGIQELIQCSIFIYEVEIENDVLISMSKKPVWELSEYVKPIYSKKLSSYIKKLTGISQNDVDKGGDFCHTLDAILTKIKDLNVSRILVWGPDVHLINYNCKIRGYAANKRMMITEKFLDISDSISKAHELEKKASQHAMCEIMEIHETGHLHDAKSDAYNLSQIFRYYCGQPLPIVLD